MLFVLCFSWECSFPCVLISDGLRFFFSVLVWGNSRGLSTLSSLLKRVFAQPYHLVVSFETDICCVSLYVVTVIHDFLCGICSHESVNACLRLLYSCVGCMITTVEGIGNRKKGLHVVQQRMVDMHGSQCGFCTPGVVIFPHKWAPLLPVFCCCVSWTLLLSVLCCPFCVPI